MEGVEWKVSLQMDTSTHQRGAACAIIAAHVLADAKLATDFMTFSTAHAAADEWVQTGNTILGLFPENHLRTKFLSASQAHTLVQAFWATGAEELEEQLPQNANAADWCTITSIDLALASLSSNWHTMLPARQSGGALEKTCFQMANDVWCDEKGEHWFTMLARVRRRALVAGENPPCKQKRTRMKDFSRAGSTCIDVSR